METYLSYSLQGFASAQAHNRQSYNTTLKNTHSKLIYLYHHCHHPSSSSLSSSFIFFFIILTHVGQEGRKAVILPVSLEESHTSCHVPFWGNIRLLLVQDQLSQVGICIKKNYIGTHVKTGRFKLLSN